MFGTQINCLSQLQSWTAQNVLINNFRVNLLRYSKLSHKVGSRSLILRTTACFYQQSAKNSSASDATQLLNQHQMLCFGSQLFLFLTHQIFNILGGGCSTAVERMQ